MVESLGIRGSGGRVLHLALGGRVSDRRVLWFALGELGRRGLGGGLREPERLNILESGICGVVW